jgi:hypothetical protein
VLYPPLDCGDDLAGVALKPEPIELLGGDAELYEEIARERSFGSTSPRFSRHRRRRAASSIPMMTRASEPPMKLRLHDVPSQFATKSLHSYDTDLFGKCN